MLVGLRSQMSLHVGRQVLQSRQRPEEEHIWEFVRMGSKRKEGGGRGPAALDQQQHTLHTPLHHSPPSPAARLKLFGRFCILRSLPSLGLPSRFRYSTSGGPSQLYLPTSASGGGGRRRGGRVPHHVRVTRESAKGRGRDLAARLRPMRVVRGPLPIHVSKQASNLPCLNQGSPRAAAASLTSFGPRETVVDLDAVVTERGKGRTFPHPINFHPPKSPPSFLSPSPSLQLLRQVSP